MSGLPPEVSPADEIEIRWERDEISTTVVASLHDASITIETTPEGAATIPWLVAALPNILEAAWAAIEADEANQEVP